MKRRALLIAGGAWFAAGATRSFAQAPTAPRRIAFVHPSTPSVADSTLAVFRDQMRKLGYREGPDFSIDARWAEGRTERLAGLAAEAVARKPDVIVTGSSAGVAAAKKASSSIPIVFASASNPVEQGFVSTLQRPGGNVTGVIVHADRMTQKIVELAREVFPAATRLAILIHEPDPSAGFQLDSYLAAARGLRFDAGVVRVARAEDLQRAFDDLARMRPEAAVVPQLAFFQTHRKEVVARALKARMALLTSELRYAESGALISYGTSVEENYRRAATQVDKILRGARVAEIPVEQPERFQLIVNMKTAKAIGVAVPAVTMLRADRVIE